MAKNLFLLPVFLLMFSCMGSKDAKQGEIEEIQEPEESTEIVAEEMQMNAPTRTDVYFKATGTEPFWGLEISPATVKLDIMDGGVIMTPHVEPIQAMDENVKMYSIETESVRLRIQLQQLDCVNQMSGEVSPYAVTIDLEYTGNGDKKHFEGCGTYVTDYRLHDIWVLETLNGLAMKNDDFMGKLPSMEVNTTENTFNGFAGCNQMNGQLFYERGLIRFTDIVTTKRFCPPPNKENEFLKALASATDYSIGNNRLELSNDNGSLLVFKKID